MFVKNPEREGNLEPAVHLEGLIRSKLVDLRATLAESEDSTKRTPLLMNNPKAPEVLRGLWTDGTWNQEFAEIS